MQNLIKLFSILFVAVMIFGCETKDVLDQQINDDPAVNVKNGFDNSTYGLINYGDCGADASIDLLSASGAKVGNATISVANGKLSVKYSALPGWFLTKTFLHIAQKAIQIPADPSAYTYVTTHSPVVAEYEVSNIDVSAYSEITVSAKSEVQQLVGNVTDLVAVAASLPLSALSINLTFIKNPSYFSMAVTGGGAIDGVYNSFCVDLDHSISPGKAYTVYSISSYSSNSALLAQLVDKPQNLDLVNYVLNTNFASLGATGTELQAAIWTLIDNKVVTNSGGGISWKQSVVNAIVADAIANGEGFVPACGGKVAILMYPGTNANTPLIKSQVTIGGIPLIEFQNSCKPVYGDPEVAIGGGVSSFKYCICDITGYEADVELVENALPQDLVNIIVKTNYPTSLWLTNLTLAGIFNGTYQGFCVDIDHYMSANVNYKVRMISSYTGDAEVIARLVDKPQNLDLVNYVLNQNYGGINAKGEDMQAAIWTLIDDKDPSGHSNYTKSIVDAIVADAYANGENYVPACDGKMMVILDPGNENVQTTFIAVNVGLVNDVCKPHYVCE